MFQIWVQTAFDVPTNKQDQEYDIVDEALKVAQEMAASGRYPHGTEIAVVEDLGQPTRRVIRKYIV